MTLKLQSADQLLNYLDDEMAWRQKEIVELRALATAALGKRADVHVRAGIALLYAHWEGFIKNAANAYINYLSHRGEMTRDMQDCFIALSIKSKLTAMGQSGKSSVAVPVVKHLLASLDLPVSLPHAGISAESNLNADVFQNITGWLGFSASKYSARFSLIDESLLGARNKIAHGEFLTINASRFASLADQIVELMQWFKTDIENAVALAAFRR
jgi:hypothetical protein